MTVGTVPAASTPHRSFAVIRPSNQANGQPMRVLYGTQSYIATPSATKPSESQPVVQAESRVIQRVASFGETYQPEVGPIQVNPMATETPEHPVVRASAATTVEMVTKTEEVPIAQTAAESDEPLEFSLSEDSLDDLLDEPATGKPLVDDSLVLKNRESSLPPTLLKPGAKTFLVAEAGANSSIKLPRLPLVSDVLAAEELKKPRSATSPSQRLTTAMDPVEAELDPAMADSDRTEIIRRTTKLEPQKPAAKSGEGSEQQTEGIVTKLKPATVKLEVTASDPVANPNPYIELLEEESQQSDEEQTNQTPIRLLP